jgi:hypothetical protein
MPLLKSCREKPTFHQSHQRSFFSLQPELDQAADGFWAGELGLLLLCDPGIERRDPIVQHPYADGHTSAGRNRPASFCLFSASAN